MGGAVGGADGRAGVGGGLEGSQGACAARGRVRPRDGRAKRRERFSACGLAARVGARARAGQRGAMRSGRRRRRPWWQRRVCASQRRATGHARGLCSAGVPQGRARTEAFVDREVDEYHREHAGREHDAVIGRAGVNALLDLLGDLGFDCALRAQIGRAARQGTGMTRARSEATDGGGVDRPCRLARPDGGGVRPWRACVGPWRR
jgi:hypothetical protein